uniref:Uncharacterized protein n=1 Tax=Anopheles christyi TaxID=43041 RepID=A0A182KIR8_9DIPT
MLHQRWKCTTFRRPAPAHNRTQLTSRLTALLRQAYWAYGFGELYRLAQLQKSDIVIVGVLIEAPMPYDRGDRSHYGRSLRSYELVIIT